MLGLDNSKGLTCIRGRHVMVQPDGRRYLLVAESHDELSPACALHVDVRRLVFARRRVDVDAECALVVHLHHVANITQRWVASSPAGDSMAEECLTLNCC